MKLGIFTDSHYSSQEITCGRRYNSRSLQKIRQAYAFFERENCDLIVSLGDLIDKEDSHAEEIRHLKEIAAVITAAHIPTVCLMGNHDAFAFDVEEFYEILDGCYPKNLRVGNMNLIFLDACHFRNGRHYAPGDSDWTDTYLPHLSELEALLSDTKGQTYLFLHQNVDPAISEDHRIANADALIAGIEKSGTVRAVFQGHYHPGKISRYGDVDYITLPAMCENEGAFRVFEL